MDPVTLLSELEVAAITVWGEARGEGRAGMEAVAWVLRHRARDGRHGRSLVQVARRPRQFSCWEDPNVKALAEAIAKQKATPSSYVKAYDATRAVLRDEVPDPVQGATHYYAPKGMIPPGRVPKWAVNKTPCAVIGGHLFFNDIAW